MVSRRFAQARPGSRYGYRIDGNLVVPDPASRFQPDDVHGLSLVIDPQSYEWSDTAWRGRPWEETVLYEVHVGTATPEGTYAGLMSKLEDLARHWHHGHRTHADRRVPGPAELGL